VRLCSGLAAIFAGASTASAPAWKHRNVWGGFSFRAQWLEVADAPGGLVGITTTRQEPLPLRLLRGLDTTALSGRQRQIALLLADGMSHAQIAQQLAISHHTAIAHGRRIYEKLDVHNRAGLVTRLLAS